MKPGPWLLLLGFVQYLGEGKSNTLLYEPNNGCRNSTTEYFTEKINRCCSKCTPGTRRKTECTSDIDTVCEKCQDGLFMESFNYHHNCFKCTKCDAGKGLKYEKICTKESDAVCVCKPGYFCSMDSEEASCSLCKKYKECPPGKGARTPVQPDSDIKCDPCPEGTFSSETSSVPCKPHTRCDLQGKHVLNIGTSTSDTTCGSSVAVTTTPVTAQQNHTSLLSTKKENSTTADLTTALSPVTKLVLDASSKASSHGQNWFLWLGLGVAGLSLVILIVAVWKCLKKDALKAADDGASKTSKQNIDTNSLSSPNEKEILISEFKTDPSTSSSDNHSQNTVISQDCNHTEPPTIAKQCVNLSFTATFNCQVNPSSGTCSIPISPCMQPVEDEFPFSEEEELCMSSQEEDSKGALPSVQESGMTVLKVSESPPTSLYCQR